MRGKQEKECSASMSLGSMDKYINQHSIALHKQHKPYDQCIIDSFLKNNITIKILTADWKNILNALCRHDANQPYSRKE